MNALDIAIGLVACFGAAKGYARGFVVEVFALLAFFFGLYFAIELSIPVTNRYFGQSSYSGILSIVVFVVLFVLLSLLIKAGASLLKKVIDLTFLGFLDNLLGAFLGICKWLLVASLVFWVFDVLKVNPIESLQSESFTFPYVKDLGPKAFSFVGTIIPYFRDVYELMHNLKKDSQFVFAS